jgi:hypothetical protein
MAEIAFSGQRSANSQKADGGRLIAGCLYESLTLTLTLTLTLFTSFPGGYS